MTFIGQKMRYIQLKTLGKKSQLGLRQFRTVTFYLKFYVLTMNIEISFNGSQVLHLYDYKWCTVFKEFLSHIVLFFHISFKAAH